VREGGPRRRGRRTVLALLACLPLLLVLAPAVAEGHGENSPVVQTVIDSVPGVPGVKAHTLPSQPLRIDVLNTTKTELEVRGFVGEPFVRIGPTGVHVNLNSPTYYRSGNPDAGGVKPASAHRGAPPRWALVSRTPEFGWFDFRMEPGRTPIPAQARTADRPLRLDSWSIPVRYGGQASAIQGHVEFQPIVGAVVPRMTSPPNLTTGVEVGLLTGSAPGLFVTNTGREPVTVIGKDGKPFARIGPSGVLVNQSSATYADTVAASGDSPPRIDPQAPPRWTKVATVPQYGWVDYRLSYAHPVPPEIQRDARPKVLLRWSVPILAGGRHALIAGTDTWTPFVVPGQPAKSSNPLSAWLLGGLPAMGFIALLGLALRRRQASHAPVAGRPARAA